MHRPSKIDKLPVEIREQIAKLRDDGHTLDEIMVHLAKIGLDEDGMPSRSGLHRHVQNLDALAEIITTSRASAEALARRPEDPGAADRGLQLNVELLHGLTTRLVAKTAAGEGGTFNAKELGFLAGAVKSLAGAARADAMTKMAIRKELRDEMDKHVADIEADPETKTLSPAEVLDRIRALYRGEG